MQDTKPNVSALELRIKQTNRYMTIGLLAVLALCVLLFMYVGSVKQNEQAAISNTQTQADETKDSDICKVYPEQELCVLARKIAADPTATIIPTNGTNGTNGENGKPGLDGRGITKFDLASGNLIVVYTDGQTQDLGPVVGKDGATGATGLTGQSGMDGKDGVDGQNGQDGRGIVSTDIISGSLIVTYSDGTVQDAGVVVGPKGDPGENGTDGAPGATGAPGLTPVSVDTDINGYVTITYSDGTTETAGRVLLPTLETFTCNNGTLTLKLSNGPAKAIAADCSPDDLPPVPNSASAIYP
jgi:hypothetical protein